YYGQNLDLERCLIFEVMTEAGKPMPFGMQLYEPISRLQDLYETEAQAAIQDGLGSVYATQIPGFTGVTSEEVVQQFINKLDKNLSTKGILNGWEIKPVADRRRSPDFYASAIQHNLNLLYTAFCMEWKTMGESSVGVYGSYMAALDSYKSTLEAIKDRFVTAINDLIAREASWNNEPQTAWVQAGPISFEDKPNITSIEDQKTQSLSDWLQDKGESVKKAFIKEVENRRAGGIKRPFKVTEATYATKILGYDEQIVRANWASVQEKLRRLLDDGVDSDDDYMLGADFDTIWSEFATKMKERR
ncbi:MAG TPA: hypothetical protein PLX04_08285, partial [Caldisericia bacterium]|nr:hypothetical protein [Caldisericia bacterium]